MFDIEAVTKKQSAHYRRWGQLAVYTSSKRADNRSFVDIRGHLAQKKLGENDWGLTVENRWSSTGRASNERIIMLRKQWRLIRIRWSHKRLLLCSIAPVARL